MTAITQHHDLNELRGLIAKATPGPWEYENDREGSSMGWIGHQIEAGRSTVFSALFDVCGDSGQQEINSLLIVAAVNALPSLLDHIDRLTEDNVRLREAMVGAMSFMGNVDYSRGGGSNTASMYGDMLNDIRQLLRQALTPAASEGK